MGNQKKCVIICSGDLVQRDVSAFVSDALVISADGGIDRAKAMGISVDVLIGDGDSMCSQNEMFHQTYISLPTEKDMTDTDACVSYALERVYTDFVFLCCTGGRLDHMLSNIMLLERLLDCGCKGMICDDCNEITAMEPGTYEIANDPFYRYVSLIPMDRVLEHVSLSGFKYPLEDHTLYRTNASLSVSNEIVADTAKIQIGSGRTLLIRSRDRK